ncbi:glycosyltransferase family 2 protein [Acidiphilium sp. PA]|uniref:glycosyltransferase family 2 protein n=1 Tax=Acidiphilium sp. PA TaxID=2871705 RepID=UPI002243A581|nr:glycosyltransferase family 2 protein [Acidiphilium sp. PA]MCW8306323.1 glycosyltransferase family 2 protein [Acidiphilium sp. PA]
MNNALPPAPSLISIIVPFHNEAENVQTLHTRLAEVLEAGPDPWELVCVNDGSRDDTLARLVALAERDARVRVIDLSRNFGKEAALTAGLDFARGDAVIPLDADLQDPPEIIPALIAKWREGFEVVNAVRASREGDGPVKRATAHAFYRVINRMSQVDIPADTGDFRLISRPALEALKRLPERRRFMKGLFAWVGFRTATITYDRAPRHAGTTTWNYWKLWNFAIEGITSFSSAPLRLASYLGFGVSVLAFIYALITIFNKLVYGNPVKGYPSLLVAVLFLGGVQLLALGVLGEYLGRLYEESKQRPIYLVRAVWQPPDPE